MLNNSNLLIEEVPLKNHLNVGFKFSVPDNYVIYFEKEFNEEFNFYIRKNYEVLKADFSRKGFNFIYLPIIEGFVHNVDHVIEYYCPQLNYFNISKKASEIFDYEIAKNVMSRVFNEMGNQQENISPPSVDYNKIFSFEKHESQINSGLFFFKPYSGIIGSSDYFNSKEHLDYQLFFDEAILFLKKDEPEFDLSIDFSFFPAFSEELDDDAKEVISDIENKLSQLQDSGQLLFLIPILKDLLQKQSEKIDFFSISKMEIDFQNRIMLPYFKKEVMMSHLTKSIYFLFLKHPEGINLKELGNYKKELLTIYTSVSNQLDYDKMAKSVDDVVNLETKAIYTHLSRIKSAFYKIMDDSFAQNYIVSGSGEAERKVLFNTLSITWNNYRPLDGFDL